VNGIIYTFFDKTIFAYDPTTNGWTFKAAIPEWSLASGGSVSGVVDGIVYLFGGLSADDSVIFNLTLAYDPIRNSFAAKRPMPDTCSDTKCGSTRAYAAAATIGNKIYISRGLNANPSMDLNAFGYRSTLEFDPKGGVTPQIISATIESSNQLRLVWHAEAGVKYGVESSPQIITDQWARVMLPTGFTVTATNDLAETSCTCVPEQPQQFFRIIEAN